MSRSRRSLLTLSILLAAVVPALGQSAPADLVALPQATGAIQLTWTDVTGDEDGFVLERRTGTAAWQPIADIAALPPGSSEYVDNVGLVRERYEYRVASSHPAGLSAWSNTASAVPVFIDKPFYGWLNVNDYGSCVIPGVSDPHPIQCAIHEGLGGRTDPGINPAIGPHVLYFPNGEYPIDSTLFLEGRAGIQFVGQSAGGVTLKWVGAPGSGPDDTAAMFHAEGNRDSTWRNLIWDGNCADPTSCFVVAFDQSFCGRSDTSVLRSDDCGPENLGWPESETLGVSDNSGAHFDSVFRNAYVGLRLGHYGVADDTTTFRRCRFENNFSGVSLEDFNALGHYFWDNLFEANFVGITNNISEARHEFDPGYLPGICEGQPGQPACFYHIDCEEGYRCEWVPRRAGDFVMYRGRFVDNSHTDIWADPTGDFIIRNNWSSGSGRFFFGGGPNASTGRYSLIANRVWDDQGLAIETKTPGAFLFLDNEIYTDPNASEAPVVLDALVGFDPAYPDSGTIDLVTIGNVYTRPTPYDFREVHRLRQVDDGSTAETPAVSIPPLPLPQDLLNGRNVYTVTDAHSNDALANAERIQSIIDLAAADPTPAIVHFPSGLGRFLVSQTLSVPAGSDLILVGDGGYTTLWWLGAAGQPILEIDAAGVNGLTVRDLQFLSAGIVVKNLNQENGRAFVSQLRMAESGAAGLVVQELDSMPVDLVDFKSNFGYFAGDEAVGALVKVGSQPVAEQPGIAFWSGDTDKNVWDYVVVNGPAGAKVLIHGNYMEKSRHHLRVVGNGAGGDVTVHGSKLAPAVPLNDPSDPAELAAATATVSVEDFAGNVSLTTSQMFVVDANSSDSDPVAADHGARIRVVGSQAAAVEIESVGVTLRRQPRPDDPDNAYADLPEFDFSDAGPNSVNYLRLAGKRAIAIALPLLDIRATETSDPLNPDVIGDNLPTPDRDRLLNSVALLRSMEMPGFYDEPGESAPRQINFDKVFIMKSPTTALLLSGGTPCVDNADCSDAVACTIDSCDTGDLPQGVAGQCRFTPDDSACDDGLWCNGVETCTAAGCAAGVEPCPDDCDEELDLCVAVCNGDGTCGAGEDCLTCPDECFSVVPGTCGNGICEPSAGEDCLSCDADCRGKQGGVPKRRYCCGDGDGQNPVGCDDSRCTSEPFACSDVPQASSCCGDGLCEGTEDSDNCIVDCQPTPSFCGNGSCDPAEDSCSCPEDCGAADPTEGNCTNGADDDCDGTTDCEDTDCFDDPACQTSVCDDDGICEPGEDCDNCSNDCDGQSTGKPSGRYCCGNGVVEGPEADGRCDGNP